MIWLRSHVKIDWPTMSQLGEISVDTFDKRYSEDILYCTFTFDLPIR